jgi:hypothetical protein
MATATLPASFFQGKSLKEGARCEVEIENVDGDQVTVSYVPHEDDKENSPYDHPPADHADFNASVDQAAGGGSGY